MYPVEHVSTMNIPTAATDGKRYYWNPKFILKQIVLACASFVLTKLGMLSICIHLVEVLGYLSYGTLPLTTSSMARCMDDFKTRKMDAGETFTKHLGRYMTLTDYMELLKNPFAKIKGFEDFNPGHARIANPAMELPAANEDRELTPEEQKELERREKRAKFYYADPDLEEDMKRPEKIYDLLYALLPKCPKCGGVGPCINITQEGKLVRASLSSKVR